MRVIGRRALASAGGIGFLRKADDELQFAWNASAQNMFTATDARVCAVGGKCASRSSRKDRRVSIPISGRAETLDAGDQARTLESSISAISWTAIIGGAFAAAALSLILLAFGSGFGLASVSPWPHAGASVTTFTAMTAIWLVIVQWISSTLGGYLTGWLRTKWVGAHQ